MCVPHRYVGSSLVAVFGLLSGMSWVSLSAVFSQCYLPWYGGRWNLPRGDRCQRHMSIVESLEAFFGFLIAMMVVTFGVMFGQAQPPAVRRW